MAHDVFISYSSKNKTTADAICHVLEEHEIKCWIAPRDIVGGEKYGNVIESAIKSCKVFVLIFSEESRVSPWVESELNLAFTDRRTIVPFKIDSSLLEGEMRLILNNKHWIEAYPNPELKFKALIEAVSRSIGKTILIDEKSQDQEKHNKQENDNLTNVDGKKNLFVKNRNPANQSKKQFNNPSSNSVRRIEMPYNKKLMILAIIGSLAFVFFGIWFIADTSIFTTSLFGNYTIIIIGILAILVFGITSVYFVLKLIGNKPGLVIDNTGITDNSSVISVGHISWLDIETISILEIQQQKLIMLQVKNPQNYIIKQSNIIIRILMKINYKTYGSPIILSAIYLEIKFDELISLLRVNLKRKNDKSFE